MNDRVKSRPREVATDAAELITGQTSVMRAFRDVMCLKIKYGRTEELYTQSIKPRRNAKPG
jgi:hypothetical protein